MTFHFAWVEPDQTSFSNAMKREDEEIVSFGIEHSEGDFATLRIEVRNPRIGLLNLERRRWAWFAVDGTPLFFGRIVGLPETINEEVATLTFIAKPQDYQAAKEAVAAAMRQTEYFDPVFIAGERRTEADTVLEARPMVWCIDRVTHAVTASHIVHGEAGTIAFDGGSILEGSVDVSFTGVPQRRARVEATVKWTQYGYGIIEVPVRSVMTYTAEGFLSNWPKAGTGIGGGWTVTKSDSRDRYPLGIPMIFYWNGRPAYTIYSSTIDGEIEFTYEAKRSYSEIASFAMAMNVQEMATETGDEEPITISVTGNADEPVDAGGAIPIGDLRRRAYLSSPRGARSIAYIANIAAARLYASARCVEVSFDVPFSFASSLSLRHSGKIMDPRLPGGEATGKIKAYAIRGDGGSGEFLCSVTLGCTAGYGGSVATSTGTPTYVASDYADGYQAYAGATTTVVNDPVTGDPAMVVTAVDQTVINDDGLDLYNMTRRYCVLSQTATMVASEQVGELKPQSIEDTYFSLFRNPTRYRIELRPVTGGPFETHYAISCSDLSVPRNIDLEAPSA